MKRRLLLAAAIGATMMAAPPAMALSASPTTANGAWACAAVDAVDKGVCLYDPIPPPPRHLVPSGY